MLVKICYIIITIIMQYCLHEKKGSGKMKNRKLLLIVSLILALTMAMGSTLAYLTDTDEAVNVMTLGNVDIEQIELQRKDGIKHNATLNEGDLEPFEQGQALYPAFPVNNQATDYSAEATDLLKWGPYVHTGTAANGLWNDEKLIGALDKFVFVENTGSSPAYFRTWIALECPEGMEFSAGPDKEFMINRNGSEIYDWQDVGAVTIDGVRYVLLCATYQKALEPGDASHPSLLQVVMTHNADNEDMKKLGETYEILVISQAVQVQNLEQLGATAALNVAFGEPSLDSHPWMAETEPGAQPPYSSEPAVPVMVSNAEEMVQAMSENRSVILANDIIVKDDIAIDDPLSISLNDHTLTVSKLEVKSDVTIADGTLAHGESTYPAVSVNGGKLTMNGVKVINNDQPCNVFTQGTLKAVESVALQIFSGECVLNDCDISIKSSEKCYASNVVGVAVHAGTLTMNGGSVTVDSAGATNMDSDAAFFTMKAGEKTINLNNVVLSTGSSSYLYAMEGNTVINTTDADGSWDGKVKAGSEEAYTINYK